MRLFAIVTLLTTWLLPLSALYEEQIGEWDWQLQNIGSPAAVLYEGKSMYTWTTSGVLASVNVRTGALQWRLVLPTGETIDDVVLSSSSELIALTNSGKSLRWVSTESGSLVADVSTPSPVTSTGDELTSARLVQISSDAVAVLARNTLSVVSVSQKAVTWQWEADTQQGKDLFLTSVAAHEGKLIATGCVTAPADHSVCVGVVSVVADVRLDNVKQHVMKPSSAVRRSSLISAGATLAAVTVDAAEIQTFHALSGATNQITAHSKDINLDVIATREGALQVAKVCDASGCTLYKLEDGLTPITNCKAACEGITWTRASKQYSSIAIGYVRKGSEIELSLTSLDDGNTLIREVKLPNPESPGALRMFGQFFSTSAGHTSYRALIVTAGGAWHMYQSDMLLWDRHESLAHVSEVVFVDNIASDLLELMQLEAKTHQVPGLVERLQMQRLRIRQLLAQTLATGVNVLAKVVPNLPESLTTLAASVHESQAAAFGFNKLAICWTSLKSLVAVDVVSGTVVWSLEHPAFLAGKPDRFRILATRQTATLGYLPEVMIIAEDGHQLTATLVDALSGKVSRTDVIHRSAQPVKLVNIFPTDTVDHDKREVFMFVLDDGAVAIYPEAKVHHAQPVFVHNIVKSSGELQCFKVSDEPRTLQQLASTVFSAAHEQIVNVVYPRRDDLSQSNAQILGDDGILLKYLNPHMAAVMSTSVAQTGDDSTLYVTIVDTVGCRILYRTSHKNAGQPINGIFIENWFVYSYFNAKIKRTEIGVITLYEGMLGTYDLNPFTSVQSDPEFSSFTYPAPIGLQKTFVFPRAISQLSATITAHGITTKHLLVAMESGQVVSIPLKLIDPRRPVGESSKSEKAEGLMQYSPFIPVIPIAVVNYHRVVERLQHVFSAPAKLESTSLVLSTGLDLYFTRILPSKSFDVLPSDFNQPLLMAILVGLLAIVLVVRRLQHDKRIKTSWQ